MTKAIIYETTEIVYSKAEAIKCAKNYLTRHPDENDVAVIYYSHYPDIWFICGRRNVNNISNFVKVRV